MRVTAATAALILLAAPALAEEHHTVSWYRAHPSETLAKMAACNDDPGYARHDPNCENAHEARIAMSVDETKAQVDLLQQEQDNRRRRELASNPQALLAALKYCNGLPTEDDRRIMRCSVVYATGQQVVAASKARQP